MATEHKAKFYRMEKIIEEVENLDFFTLISALWTNEDEEYVISNGDGGGNWSIDLHISKHKKCEGNVTRNIVLWVSNNATQVMFDIPIMRYICKTDSFLKMRYKLKDHLENLIPVIKNMLMEIDHRGEVDDWKLFKIEMKHIPIRFLQDKGYSNGERYATFLYKGGQVKLEFKNSRDHSCIAVNTKDESSLLSKYRKHSGKPLKERDRENFIDLVKKYVHNA